MTDVTIPADVAKRIAHDYRALIRDREERGMVVAQRREWADLLDPEPPTLREQVAQAWCAEFYGETSPSIGQGAADAVLTVVADWLAAQPVHDGTAAGLWALEPRLAQRANDVRLLRGES